MVIVQRCDELGLTSPDEYSKLHMWCTWLIARQSPGMTVTADAGEALRKTDEISTELQRMNLRYKQMGGRSHHYVVMKYPCSPDELKQNNEIVYNSAYPAGTEPALCPLCELHIDMLRSKLPCRTSHSTVRGVRQLRRPKQQMPRVGASWGKRPRTGSDLADCIEIFESPRCAETALVQYKGEHAGHDGVRNVSVLVGWR